MLFYDFCYRFPQLIGNYLKQFHTCFIFPLIGIWVTLVCVLPIILKHVI